MSSFVGPACGPQGSPAPGHCSHGCVLDPEECSEVLLRGRVVEGMWASLRNKWELLHRRSVEKTLAFPGKAPKHFQTRVTMGSLHELCPEGSSKPGEDSVGSFPKGILCREIGMIEVTKGVEKDFICEERAYINLKANYFLDKTF